MKCYDAALSSRTFTSHSHSIKHSTVENNRQQQSEKDTHTNTHTRSAPPKASLTTSIPPKASLTTTPIPPHQWFGPQIARDTVLFSGLLPLDQLSHGERITLTPTERACLFVSCRATLKMLWASRVISADAISPRISESGQGAPKEAGGRALALSAGHVYNQLEEGADGMADATCPTTVPAIGWHLSVSKRGDGPNASA